MEHDLSTYHSLIILARIGFLLIAFRVAADAAQDISGVGDVMAYLLTVAMTFVGFSIGDFSPPSLIGNLVCFGLLLICAVYRREKTNGVV